MQEHHELERSAYNIVNKYCEDKGLKVIGVANEMEMHTILLQLAKTLTRK